MCFYKANLVALQFDIDKEIDEIRFNHWIMKKENLQRINKEDVLEKGLFRMTVRNVEKDLSVTFSKARRMIKKFEELGIIECISASASRKEASIYAYTTIFKCDENAEKSDTVYDTVNSTDNAGNCNGLGVASESVNGSVNDTSKKENIKRVVKKKEFSETSNEFRAANLLYRLILKNNPKFKKPNLNQWSDSIDKMMRLDGRSIEDIVSVIKWCQNDSFWYSNILSTVKLRKQFDKLYMEMNKKKAPTAIGANKNKFNNRSICNNGNSYSMGREIL